MIIMVAFASTIIYAEIRFRKEKQCPPPLSPAAAKSLPWYSSWILNWCRVARSYETSEQTSTAPRLRLNTYKFSRLQATLCANLCCSVCYSPTHIMITSSKNLTLFSRFKYNLHLHYKFLTSSISRTFQALAAMNCLLPGS